MQFFGKHKQISIYKQISSTYLDNLFSLFWLVRSHSKLTIDRPMTNQSIFRPQLFSGYQATCKASFNCLSNDEAVVVSPAPTASSSCCTMSIVAALCIVVMAMVEKEKHLMLGYRSSYLLSYYVAPPRLLTPKL